MPTPTSHTFTPTGSLQTFVVPYYTAGTFRFTLVGGAGARQAPGPSGAGGLGGSIDAWWDPPPGTTLHIVAGYGGINGGGPGLGGEGGVSPSGANLGRGGTASDVRVGGTSVADRIIVAGAGGGGGYSSGAGGPNGGAGGVGSAAGSPGQGGGATSGAGGGLSSPGAGGTPGGTAGVGGVGGDGSSSGFGRGGGGGGGYYGGGGGAYSGSNGRGGGGGSSWADSGLFSTISSISTAAYTNGAVILAFDWIADWSPPRTGWALGLKF